jgi:hypothetical protein
VTARKTDPKEAQKLRGGKCVLVFSLPAVLIPSPEKEKNGKRKQERRWMRRQEAREKMIKPRPGKEANGTEERISPKTPHLSSLFLFDKGTK